MSEDSEKDAPTEGASAKEELDEKSETKKTEEQKQQPTHHCSIDFTIRVYISSVSIDWKLKTEQQKVMQVLDAKKIPYETVDVANNKVKLRKMRQMCENPQALPPQVFKGSRYIGDFKAFTEATDDEVLDKFLML